MLCPTLKRPMRTGKPYRSRNNWLQVATVRVQAIWLKLAGARWSTSQALAFFKCMPKWIRVRQLPRFTQPGSSRSYETAGNMSNFGSNSIRVKNPNAMRRLLLKGAWSVRQTASNKIDMSSQRNFALVHYVGMGNLPWQTGDRWPSPC